MQLSLPLFSDKASTAEFLREIAQFSDFGQRSQLVIREIEKLQIPCYINEFWTAKQRASHPLHEISYRACFKAQLPHFFIKRLSQVQSLVYDPFMGRGTTLLEAALLGRNVAGNDVNPLSKVLCEPRLRPPKFAEVKARLDEIPWNVCPKALLNDERLLPFFHPRTIQQLGSLQQWFATRQPLDPADAWIRMIASNRLTGHSPGFFSVYTLPPNQAVMPDRQRKINEQRKQSPEERDVSSLILKKSKSLISKIQASEYECLNAVHSMVGIGQADRTPFISDQSVDLVVTSPPFLDVVDYRSDNWLRCWFNGIDAQSLPISQLKNEGQWIAKMQSVFCELKRVLKSFEVGEVNKGKILLEELAIKAALAAGLSPKGIMINQQEFTKTANCWGVGNSTLGTNTNRIVLLRKMH
jgi:hypothetical protein